MARLGLQIRDGIFVQYMYKFFFVMLYATESVFGNNLFMELEGVYV